jgi:hypothetical protein
MGKDDCWCLTSNDGSSRHRSRVVGDRHPFTLYNVLSAMVVGNMSIGKGGSCKSTVGRVLFSWSG